VVNSTIMNAKVSAILTAIWMSLMLCSWLYIQLIIHL
jgi:hypothetical protein